MTVVPAPPVAVAPAVADIVRPAVAAVDDVQVVDALPALAAAMDVAAAALRAADPASLAGRIAAVRTMYKRVGLDPTRTRPSSEALLRRVRRGDPLPHVNTLVDVINWCSVELQLPFGLYDRAAVEGPITLRLGAPGESYAGIRKDDVHLGGRLTLADGRGPFGNPTSDSLRTSVTTATRQALVVVFVPGPLEAGTGPAAVALTTGRIGAWC